MWPMSTRGSIEPLVFAALSSTAPLMPTELTARRSRPDLPRAARNQKGGRARTEMSQRSPVVVINPPRAPQLLLRLGRRIVLPWVLPDDPSRRDVAHGGSRARPA